MSKLTTGWIVLIVIGSLVVCSLLIYFLYRLYVKYIYTRKRSWNEIILPPTGTHTNTEMHENEIFAELSLVPPRKSMSPLIQDFLPKEPGRNQARRKMVTKLEFDKAPVLTCNLEAEWNEMDRRSSILDLYSSSLHKRVSSPLIELSPSISTQASSYFTLAEECSREKSMPLDRSLGELSSAEFVLSTSSSQNSNPVIDQNEMQPRWFFNPLVHLSKRLFDVGQNANKNVNLTLTTSQLNSSNTKNPYHHLVLEMDKPMRIKNSTNPSSV